jgi:hypothetical protein
MLTCLKMHHGFDGRRLAGRECNSCFLAEGFGFWEMIVSISGGGAEILARIDSIERHRARQPSPKHGSGSKGDNNEALNWALWTILVTKK